MLRKTKALNKTSKYIGYMTSVLLLICGMLAMPAHSGNTAEKSGNTPQVESTICNTIKILSDPIARGVAAFGIIFLGFSLFLGKISWGVALSIGVAIGALFGAQGIVQLLGYSVDNCSNFLIIT